MATSLSKTDRILQALGQEYLGRRLQLGSPISISEPKSLAIADAFEFGQHNPDDRDTVESYRAFTAETQDQFNLLVRSGYRFLPWMHHGQPYKNSKEMIRDVRDNRHLYVYMTRQGFGHESDGLDQSKNPLLSPSMVVKGWCNNDIFRAVHDVLGHAIGGFAFSASGELNAWRTHLEFFSPVARRAMTTETLGTNSWVMFSAAYRSEDGTLIRNSDPRWIPLEKRRYSAQKMMLMPNWVERIYVEP
jgi:hypothetical protein